MDDPALVHLSETDPVLRELIRSIGPYSLHTAEDGWGVLLAAIAYQQVTGAAAKGICTRIMAKHQGRFPTPSEVLSMPSGSWQSFGLTRRKEETIRALASAVADAELNLLELATCDDDEIVEVLTGWSGVGPWTAGMWLVFHLGRRNVVFPGDVGVRKAIRIQYATRDLPKSSEVVAFAERWSPYRTVACWYLWKSLPGFPEPGFRDLISGPA